jgi:hypothetical protein
VHHGFNCRVDAGLGTRLHGRCLQARAFGDVYRLLLRCSHQLLLNRLGQGITGVSGLMHAAPAVLFGLTHQSLAIALCRIHCLARLGFGCQDH